MCTSTTRSVLASSVHARSGGRSGTTCPGVQPRKWPSGYSAESRSEEHTSELQSRRDLVCRLLLEKKNPTDFETVRGGRDCRDSLQRAGDGVEHLPKPLVEDVFRSGHSPPFPYTTLFRSFDDEIGVGVERPREIRRQERHHLSRRPAEKMAVGVLRRI